ncbi:MAG: ketoacyl-ACP synthase III [Deltaproteobacteria bacterium]|nr:ketoacyl-ACP synthase III [Deltaproteobacteria bacterium]
MSELRGRISGCGSYVPEFILSNAGIEKMVETTDAWITARTGIKQRRITLNEKTSVVAAKAAKEALAAASVSPRDIDLVITGTVTPDMVFPSTSCFVQQELGIRPGIPAFDISAACSGFLYALDCADKYIRAGGVKKALVIGVDIFSRILDWTDRATCVLFGDGAGAVVLTETRGKSGILSSHIHSDGRQWEMLYTPGSIGSNPFEERKHLPGPRNAYLKMKGNETFKVAVRTMGGAIKEELQANSLKPSDIALLIPHQANIRIIDAVGERLGLSSGQVFSNIDRYGNTSAASIPIALDEALKAGKIKKGDIVMFVSFGGGLTWASAAVRW